MPKILFYGILAKLITSSQYALDKTRKKGTGKMLAGAIDDGAENAMSAEHHCQ